MTRRFAIAGLIRTAATAPATYYYLVEARTS